MRGLLGVGSAWWDWRAGGWRDSGASAGVGDRRGWNVAVGWMMGVPADGHGLMQNAKVWKSFRSFLEMIRNVCELLSP